MSRAANLSMFPEGPDALLIDAASDRYRDDTQAKIWFLADQLGGHDGICETVPGMNNLMVVFDPFKVDLERLQEKIEKLWVIAPEEAELRPEIEVEVRYGGDDGPDLASVAAAKGMSEDELVKAHMAPVYTVAAVGAMPGFVYLSGMDARLSIPRLATPRQNVPAGAVIIGGSQAGIMPVTAPSGWHILGRTDFPLFDPHRSRPAIFRPGDRIRFVDGSAR